MTKALTGGKKKRVPALACHLPPGEIVMAFCAACGDLGACARPSQKGLLIRKNCMFCDAERVHLVRYRMQAGESGRVKLAERARIVNKRAPIVNKRGKS
jgi:hypothetical protein